MRFPLSIADRPGEIINAEYRASPGCVHVVNDGEQLRGRHFADRLSMLAPRDDVAMDTFPHTEAIQDDRGNG